MSAVRVPKGLSIRRPPGATFRDGRLCWRIARLATGRHRVFRLLAVAQHVSRARTVVVGTTVQGAGVRTRRARVVLRITRAHVRPPGFTG